MFNNLMKEKIKALREELSKEQRENNGLHMLTSNLTESLLESDKELSELKAKNDDLEQQVQELKVNAIVGEPVYYMIAYTDFPNTYYFQEFDDKQGATHYPTRQAALSKVRYINEVQDKTWYVVPVYKVK